MRVCAATYRTEEELEEGDFLVSLNVENRANDKPRNYYSYNFLLQWYAQQYRKGYSFKAIETHLALNPPQSDPNIIPHSSINTAQMVYEWLAFFTTVFIIYLYMAPDRSCDNYSAEWASLEEEKNRALDLYKAGIAGTKQALDFFVNQGGSHTPLDPSVALNIHNLFHIFDRYQEKLTRELDEINGVQESSSQRCNDIIIRNHGEIGLFFYLKNIAPVLIILVFLAKVINRFFKKGHESIVKDWLNQHITKADPTADDQEEGSESGPEQSDAVLRHRQPTP